MNDVIDLGEHFARKRTNSWPLNKSLRTQVEGNYVNIYYGDELIISFENNRDGVDEMIIFSGENSDEPTLIRELKSEVEDR